MTFADVWPSIRCNASTFTPALTASDSQVWRRSWGVMSWTLALLTAAANHPPDDLGRGKYPRPARGRPIHRELYPRHCMESSSSTNAGTERALRPFVGSFAQDRYRGCGIPYVKVGRRVRYLAADFAHYLATHCTGGDGAP